MSLRGVLQQLDHLGKTGFLTNIFPATVPCIIIHSFKHFISLQVEWEAGKKALSKQLEGLPASLLL